MTDPKPSNGGISEESPHKTPLKDSKEKKREDLLQSEEYLGDPKPSNGGISEEAPHKTPLKDSKEKKKEDLDTLAEDGSDRLSVLPHDPLFCILRDLSLPEIIRTSLLSSVWRTKWYKIPSITHLALVDRSTRYDLPDSIYSLEGLTVLKLQHFVLADPPTSFSGFPHLSTFHARRGTISQSAIETILPKGQIQSLQIISCKGFEKLSLSERSLQSFAFIGSQALSFSGTTELRHVFIRKVSHEEGGPVHYQGVKAIEGLQYCQELYAQGCFFQAIRSLKTDFYGWTELAYLDISLDLSKSASVLYCIGRDAINLKYLVLRSLPFVPSDFFTEVFPNQRENCFLSLVECTCTDFQCVGEEIAFLRYLLLSAPGLVITCFSVLNSVSIEERLAVENEMLLLTRASEAGVFFYGYVNVPDVPNWVEL